MSFEEFEKRFGANYQPTPEQKITTADVFISFVAAIALAFVIVGVLW